MAMDRMQEEIDDYVNGDINEQVEAIVQQRVKEIIGKRSRLNHNLMLSQIEEDLYIEGWPEEDRYREARRRLKEAIEQYDVSEDTIKKIRQEVRQEILDKMEFKRKFQEERHLDDLQEQQRRYDEKRYEYTSAHMLDRWWNEKQAMDAESRIYTDDINGINPNAVVNYYEYIASYFNIRDTKTMGKILEGAQNGNIDGVAFRGLIESEEGKTMIEKMMRDNSGNLNVEQLMDTVSQIMKGNADSRVKTAEGYMDVAKKDLDARATGVERKVDALNKTAETSVKRDQAYLKTIDNAYSQGMDSARKSEDEVRRRISLVEIEKATDSVRSSTINANAQEIKQNQSAKEENKDDAEKE